MSKRAAPSRHHRSALEEVEHDELRLEQHFHVQHAHKYIVGYLFVLALMIVTASVYSWQHRQVSQLEAQKQMLTQQLESVYR